MTETFYRVVHLDLKGAPPKVNYIEQIFPLFSKWGANSVLIEYEDMFPYQDNLSVLATQSAYSKGDIRKIQQVAAQNDLMVIPLVQCFGHFEFVLKHKKFKHLREVPHYPTALCPSNPDSLAVVTSMIDQVMSLHPQIQWFHIGADEVYHIGICEKCQKRMQEESLLLHHLFFAHVRTVLTYLKTHYSHVKAIMWDDMMRCIDLSSLQESGLGSLVEPMVWHYLAQFRLPQDLWDRFSTVFKNIWVASAFKGATGSCTYITNTLYHVNNHMTWNSIIQKEKHKFTSIRGITLTGWQRFDHYAVLCELLPQALPCLALCLQVFSTESFTSEIHLSVSKQLEFDSLIPLFTDNKSVNPIPCCSFPGSDIYSGILELLPVKAEYEEYMHSDRRFTWMNEYNLGRHFINPMHVETLVDEAVRIMTKLQQLHGRLQQSLSAVYFKDTVEEWQNIHIRVKLDKLKDVVGVGTQLLADAKRES